MQEVASDGQFPTPDRIVHRRLRKEIALALSSEGVQLSPSLWQDPDEVGEILIELNELDWHVIKFIKC